MDKKTQDDLQNAFGGPRLIEYLTFETYVPGKANALARAAALKVAEHPGTAYNPLYFYGDVGLGKTHLLHAIGNRVLQTNARAKVGYVHAERYVSDMFRSLRSGNLDAFKLHYHSLNLLLVDDIQFLAGKASSQEQFLSTFDDLVGWQSQVVITSDRLASDLPNFSSKLISRFDSGMMFALEAPKLEQRVAILFNKAQQQGIELDCATAQFIATRIRGNVRTLESGLIRVLAYARFHQLPVSTKTAKQGFKDVFRTLRK
jgi:chromosomal replication initiator protein